MTVFVSGGAGYIGSHILVELLSRGYDVVAADNFSNSHPKALERIKKITGREFAFYHLDVRDEKALDTVFTRHKIGCVIHLAGLKSVGQSLSAPIEYYHNNINSTLILSRVMEKHNVAKMIFSSSATVYSGTNPMPVSETAVTGDCVNPYGWTKYMSEQILRDIAVASQDFSVLLLRYFNPAGAHESGLIGEDPSGTPNNLAPYISQAAIGRREKLYIYGGDYDTVDGTGVRDYIHVTDLARGHVAAIGYSAGQTGVEAFNLGTGQGTSVLEMVSAFERVNRVKVPWEMAARRPGDLGVCYADPSKANRVLGWRAEKSLEDMCADAWRWQLKNPHGYAKA